MIQIIDKSLCCGCSACVQRCPKQCITLHEDHEGFLYPKVDTYTCIDCGLCEKVCPILNEGIPHLPLKVYAAINKDEKIRLESSSGGIFTLLAEKTINEGGVVFGARFDENWQVCLDYTEAIEGIAAFRGSKYVQARTENTYQQVERFLKEGRKVLFTGTPCQIAGLKKFLRKEYDNLLAVDFVCHGVPSPKVWRKYLQELLASKGEKNTVSFSSNPSSVSEGYAQIAGISFRNKALGWKKYSFVLRQNLTKATADGEGNSVSFSDIHKENIFMRAFLSDMISRPSCYQCHCKEGKSGADITIADFWGIGNISPEMDDDKGTSLIILQTERGEQVFSALDIVKKEQTYEEAESSNPGLKSFCRPHPKREKFFLNLGKNNLNNLINRILRKPYFVRVKSYIKHKWLKIFK